MLLHFCRFLFFYLHKMRIVYNILLAKKKVLWIQNFDIENLLQYLFSSFTMLNLTSGVNLNVSRTYCRLSRLLTGGVDLKKTKKNIIGHHKKTACPLFLCNFLYRINVNAVKPDTRKTKFKNTFIRNILI